LNERWKGCNVSTADELAQIAAEVNVCTRCKLHQGTIKAVPGEKISRIHGQPRWVNGRLIVPMMHPAAALHQVQNRPLIETDFRRLPEFLEQAEREAAKQQPAAPAKPDMPDLEQLSMF